MRYRAVFLAGAAVGFVIGARAGRERYDQLVRVARKAADSPAVQQAAGAVQAQASGLAKTAAERVSGELHDRVPRYTRGARDKLQERIPGMRPKNGDGRPDVAPGRYTPAPGTSRD